MQASQGSIVAVVALILLGQVGPALGAHGSAGPQVIASSSLQLSSQEEKARPVSKVVTLMQDIMKKLEKEHEEDEEVYNKFMCWCETNEKLKAKAIQDAEEKITILMPKIDDYTALANKLQVEIQNEDGFHVKLSGSFDTAAAIRHKEATEFEAQERELLEAIGALKAAIIVLSKHHTTLLQIRGSVHHGQEAGQLESAASTLRSVLRRNGDLVKGVLNPKQKSQLTSFLKLPADYFGAETKSILSQTGQRYAPQSGEIIGILKQMLEEFQRDLKEAQAEEAGAIKAYGATQASLKVQISGVEDHKLPKKAELADAQEKLAMLQIDILDTQVVMKADIKYLKMLKEQCEMMEREWEARQKRWAKEMEALSKAVAMLNSDDAEQTFTRTFNPASMLQVRSERLIQKELQSQASRFLEILAARMKSPRLAALAMHVRLDAFTRVKKAINDMIAELLVEQKDEVKHKDFCIDEVHEKEMETSKKNEEHELLAAKIEDLKMTIDALTKDLLALKKQIEDMQLQLKRGGEDREKEHQEFQVVVADQRETQRLLREALVVLSKVYKDHITLLQVKKRSPDIRGVERTDGGKTIIVKHTIVHEVKEVEVAGPPPPPMFSDHEGHDGSVLSMIEAIIADAKAMEAETIRDEESAQKAYEDFVMETNGSIQAVTKSIVTKAAEKSKLEQDLLVAQEALADVELELEQIADYKLQLHLSCDYLIKNFDRRQEARSGEIEALKQAHAILSGAKFEAFLQGAQVR